MIWLFCNLGYGRPFLEQAARAVRDEGLALTVVFSTKGQEPLPSAAGRIRGLLAGTLQRRRFRRTYGVNQMDVANVNAAEFRQRLAASDCGIIAGFNQIFAPETIARFASLVNFHPSVLPYYRGPVPSHWCLANGEHSSGFTLHRVTARIDAGETLFQRVVPIGTLRDPAALDEAIAQTAAPVLVAWLRHLKTGEPWNAVTADARSVYHHLVDYASFPGRAR